MDNEQRLEGLADRLHTNLRAAGIPFEDADIAEILERAYLHTVAAFEDLVEAMDPNTVPEYLAAGPAPIAQPAVQPDAQRTLERALPVAMRPIPGGLPWTDRPERARRHASIAEIARLVRARQVSPVELTEQSLAAIEAVDPELNAFQCLLASCARDDARAAEDEIAAGTYRGPLHGVPVAAKDLLAMAGTETTAGSTILGGWVPDFDAAAVERLRQAGAVIVGKTRLSEIAYSPGSNNAHYGPTRNPWNPLHDTGGSSSGSAAAVAAGLVYGALGTDTGGSIRIPGSLCGIVGLKPTYGRCSLFGCVSLAWSLDHIGPLARSVADAALLLEALAGHDTRDPRTRAGSSWRLDARHLETGVRGLRVGVVRDDGSGRTLGTPEALAAWQAGLRALESQGAQLVELDLPQLEALRTLNSTILVLEALTYHQSALRTRLSDFGPFPRRRVLHGLAHGPLAFVQASQLRGALRRACDQIWERVDLLSTPTMPYAAPLLGTPATTTFTGPFNCLGWPALTVPVGRDAADLPFGLQLVGRPWDEATVLRAGRVVELYGPWRVAESGASIM
ncbi:MAG TPA: amidase [Chloroflexota bacterium]|nr:amidase [Chloroflexota bacterium]